MSPIPGMVLKVKKKFYNDVWHTVKTLILGYESVIRKRQSPFLGIFHGINASRSVSVVIF